MKNQSKILPGLLLVLLVTILGCNQKDSSSELMSQVDKLLTFWNTGNFDGIENVLCEDFEIRMSPLYEPEKGIAAFKESVLSTRESYPDFKITIDESFLSDNIGAGRWTIHATSKTGRTLNIPGMSILHFADGKIKDEWISNNDLLWLEQLDYSIAPPEVENN
jgi:ketosteroid isomerase-like protein